MEVKKPPTVASLHRTIEPLGPNHDRAAFCCLDDNLTKYFCGDRALREAINRDASVYVCLGESSKVLGYFTLSSATISRDAICRGMYGNDWKINKKLFFKAIAKFPYEWVNATVLGRLAIHTDMKGKGFGAELVIKALEIAYEAAGSVASKMVILDAKNEKVASIYEGLGFERLPDSELSMYIKMDTIQQLIA